MIPVDPAPEPAVFDSKVRQPGQAFLRGLPRGSRVNFRNREYWRRILDDIHEAYKGVCAYTCHYVPLDTGADTVEHFVPKAKDTALAYEWSNFRFVCSRMNGRKRDYTDVADPFTLAPGTFQLSFPSLQVEVAAQITGSAKALAYSTVLRLRLNSERNVRARLKYVLEYRDRQINLSYLSSHAPFIHSEMARQAMTRQELKRIMPAS